MHRADPGCEWLSRPDVLPCVQERVPRDALARGRRRRHAQQAVPHGATLRPRRVARAPGRQANGAWAVRVAARRAAVPRWPAGLRPYPPPLETLALPWHPCARSASAPPRSTQGARRGPVEGEASAALAARPPWPAWPAGRSKVRQPGPALAALVACGGAGVEQAVAHAGRSRPGRTGAREGLLPLVSGAHQAPPTRWARRPARRRQAAAASQPAVAPQGLTPWLPRHALAAWPAWATPRVRALQRPASAVEGRQGYRAQRPHPQRGWPPKRSKGWTGLQHCDCH